MDAARDAAREQSGGSGRRVEQRPVPGITRTISGLLRFAGFGYWTASLLPALMGTTLPFWLRPAGFSFWWLGAIEFLVAAILLHAGFSFLQARFEAGSTSDRPRTPLLGGAGVCIVAGCLVGLHLNSGLRLHHGVPGSIFLVYGLATLFVGVLYVAPPFGFRRRVGGEVVLSVGLGLVPVLGAYLVQVGDITRRVYVAAVPLVVATALWVWTGELATRLEDEQAGRGTMVIRYGARFSGRVVVPALSVLLYATLLAAVFTASLHPAALVAVLTAWLAWRMVSVSWKETADPTRMTEPLRSAAWLHLAVGVVVAASSLAARRG